MDVQSQLLFYWEFCQTFIELWWQNERGLTDWLQEPSTHEGVPLPSYRNKRETNGFTLKKRIFSMYLKNSLSKPAGNVASRQRISFTFVAVKHTK
jgi:hypothetical protein